MSEWFQLLDTIAPSIVRIETQEGSGTGFFCGHNASNTLTAIATAFHVVEQADNWQLPIRIHNLNAGTSILIQEEDRVILPDRKSDSAIIAIFSAPKVAELKLPEEAIPFITTGQRKKVGVELAWLGYPGLTPNVLCFFTGKVSAWVKQSKIYYIDGVAINGVSGGPVFVKDPMEIVGTISAYLPNRQIGGPGLSIAQDVTHFQKFVTRMKDRDEAERKKKEEAQAQTNQLTPVPPPLPPEPGASTGSPRTR